MSNVQTIQLDAGHDKNGNPKRVFVALEDSRPIAWYLEDYSGKASITDLEHRKAYEGFSIPISSKDFQEYKKKCVKILIKR